MIPNYIIQSLPYQSHSLISLYQYLHGSLPGSLFPLSDYHSLFTSFVLFCKCFPIFDLFSLLVPPPHLCLIRRTGEELHESVFFLLPFSTSDSACISVSLHSQFPSSGDSLCLCLSFCYQNFPTSGTLFSLLIQLLVSPLSAIFLLSFSQSPLLSSILFAQMIWLSTDSPSSSHCLCQVGSTPPLPASCSFPLTRSVTIYFFPFPYFIHALCILVTFSFRCSLCVSTEQLKA